MQLHDLRGYATTRRRATPPKNESQEVKIALTCNDTPRRAGPQRSRTCPVQAACLEWALENGQDSGIWGGLSENERRALKRRSRRRAEARGRGAA